MRYTYNKEQGLLYVYLTQFALRPEEQAELADGSVVDLDCDGGVIGVEVLNLLEWRPDLFAKEFDLPEPVRKALEGLRADLLMLDRALVEA